MNITKKIITIITLFFVFLSFSINSYGLPKLSDPMPKFNSSKEFDEYIKRLNKEYKQEQEKKQKLESRSFKKNKGFSQPMAALPQGIEKGEVSDSESITNVQEQGVDEGDIVKAYKEYLVVLRRGRIFTIKLQDKDKTILKPINKINAYPQGFTKGGWYDEMLIYKNKIIVIGFSYQMRASEIGIFSINSNGKLKHQDTFFIDSNDYYSSRNYASRLVDGKLIMYMPYYLFSWTYGKNYERTVSFPKVKKWLEKNEVSKGVSILTKKDIYKPIQNTLTPTLHTILTCDLDSKNFSCKAKAVLSPYSRNFYVSPDAVYIWVSPGYSYYRDDSKNKQEKYSYVYMMLLKDGSARAAKTYGSPIDQFSFKQGQDGYLNVITNKVGYGDAMWHPEFHDANLALLRTSLRNFTKDAKIISKKDYKKLPNLEGYTIQNRFIGDYLLYGSGSNWYYDSKAEYKIFIKAYKAKEKTKIIKLTHSVDRIDIIGSSGVVVGIKDKDLKFTSIELGNKPKLVDTYTLENASQGELRSHGFFYKPISKDNGVLGLPIRKDASWTHLLEKSAGILYLRVNNNKFSKIGTLLSKSKNTLDDQCIASCVDWYGNSRPIFYKDRVFALLGYELVEGKIRLNKIKETNRANFYK